MTSKTTLFLMCAALLGSGATARADEAYDQCRAAPGADAALCGEQWLAREQGALDAKWTSIIEQTDGAVADSLASEQTAWTAFKDASCGFMHDDAFAPGGDKSTYFTCRAGVISDRMKAIGAYATYIDN